MAVRGWGDEVEAGDTWRADEPDSYACSALPPSRASRVSPASLVVGLGPCLLFGLRPFLFVGHMIFGFSGL